MPCRIFSPKVTIRMSLAPTFWRISSGTTCQAGSSILRRICPWIKCCNAMAKSSTSSRARTSRTTALSGGLCEKKIVIGASSASAGSSRDSSKARWILIIAEALSKRSTRIMPVKVRSSARRSSSAFPLSRMQI